MLVLVSVVFVVLFFVVGMTFFTRVSLNPFSTRSGLNPSTGWHAPSSPITTWLDVQHSVELLEIFVVILPFLGGGQRVRVELLTLTLNPLAHLYQVGPFPS